jgi:hypothetical protein
MSGLPNSEDHGAGFTLNLLEGPDCSNEVGTKCLFARESEEESGVNLVFDFKRGVADSEWFLARGI